MNFNKIILAVFVLTLLAFGSCNLSDTGKARIMKAQGHVPAADLDVLEVWCPYGYYCIDWRITLPDSSHAFITSKGLNKGKLFLSSFQIMNRFIKGNFLDIDSLNGVLQEMQPEKPYLIHHHRIKTNEYQNAELMHFLIFTKNKALVNDTTQLIQITEQHER
jgi:hypothetical protein